MLAVRVLCAVLIPLLSLGCQPSRVESRRSNFEPLPPPPVISEPDPEASVTVNPQFKPAPVRLVGRQLLVQGKPFVIQAVCWNPVRKGRQQGDGLIFRNPSSDDLALIEKDFQLMVAMGVNTLRTYEPIMNDAVLALVQKYQLHMIVPVFNYYATPWADVTARVNKLKDNAGVLFWEIGNEWNYNQFYSAGSPQAVGLEGAKELVKKAASLIRSLDGRLPISTVYGELPPKALVDELTGIDVWGLNIYSGLSFGDRFNSWKNLSEKPMYLGEYGADAINRTVLDEASQAKALVALTGEIKANTAITLGGAVFEWNDEWWKDAAGGADAHDIGGIAPGGGPYPDSVFNEEWWGLVDIDRQPRLVYGELKKIWKPVVEETF